MSVDTPAKTACPRVGRTRVPRALLAMCAVAATLERAGRTDDALDTYTSALEVYAGYIPAMQGLARLQLRSGRTDDRTPGFLREIALRGDSQEWREWAATQQALRTR